MGGFALTQVFGVSKQCVLLGAINALPKHFCHEHLSLVISSSHYVKYGIKSTREYMNS
jgi:hypothetical protein